VDWTNITADDGRQDAAILWDGLGTEDKQRIKKNEQQTPNIEA
jgi:hypothetical protein